MCISLPPPRCSTVLASESTYSGAETFSGRKPLILFAITVVCAHLVDQNVIK